MARSAAQTPRCVFNTSRAIELPSTRACWSIKLAQLACRGLHRLPYICTRAKGVHDRRSSCAIRAQTTLTADAPAYATCYTYTTPDNLACWYLHGQSPHLPMLSKSCPTAGRPKLTGTILALASHMWPRYGHLLACVPLAQIKWCLWPQHTMSNICGVCCR